MKRNMHVSRERRLSLMGRRHSPSASSSFLFGKGVADEKAAALAGASAEMSVFQRAASGEEAAADVGGGRGKEGSRFLGGAREGEERKKGRYTNGKKNVPQAGVRRQRKEAVTVGADYKSSRLFIRNLPPFVSVVELKEKFSSLGGEVTDVCLLVTEAGRSRQCAFLGFKTQAQAAAAKDYFNATFFYTRKITVDFALPRQVASTALSSSFSSSSSSSASSSLSGVVGTSHSVCHAAAREKDAAATAADTDNAALLQDSSSSSSSGKSSETQREGNGRKTVAGGKRATGREKKTRGAAAYVVEEEVVQAHKAGVSTVRKRLLFEDFFSSSDEETTTKKDAEAVPEGSSSSSVGHGVSQQQEKKKRKRSAAAGAETDSAGDGVRTAAGGDGTGAAAVKHSSKGATKSRSKDAADRGGGSEGAAERNSSAGATERKPSEGATERKLSEGATERSSEGMVSEVDDLTWLRQASAAHAAEVSAERGMSAAVQLVGGGEGEETRGERGIGGTSVVVGSEENALEQQQQQEALSSLGVHGRLLLRNFPFATTQEELEALCREYGEVAETHVVYDEETRKSKGYAFITFVFPEHAVAALGKLDGMIFQGRLLRAEAAKPDTQKELRRQQREEQQQKKGSSSSYKRKKQQELLQQHCENQAYMEEKVWNLLYVSANAAVDAVAREFQVDKGELLGVDRADSTAAARVALAETHLLQATREWIIKEGISAKAFERRGPTLLAATAAAPVVSNTSLAAAKKTKGSSDQSGSSVLLTEKGQTSTQQDEETHAVGRSRDTLIVKHLPTAHVVGAELLLLFEKIGKVERFMLAPSKTVAIVQYEKERDAAAAFRRLAYRKYKNVPLFIEKAPVDIFVEEDEERRQAQAEAAEEVKAASHADTLAAGSRTPVQRSEVRDEGASTAADKHAAARNNASKEGRERREAGVSGGEGDEDQEDEIARATEQSESSRDKAADKLRTKTAVGAGKKNRNEIKEMGSNGSRVHTLQSSAAVSSAAAGFTTAEASSGGTEVTAVGGKDKEEEENVDDVGGYSLFVKNLNFCTTEAALREVFAPCAGLRKVTLMTKKRPVAAKRSEEEGGKMSFEHKERGGAPEATAFETLSLGYAFVEFDSAANAAAACKRMLDVVVDGHTLKISISRSAPQQRSRNALSPLLGGCGSTAAGHKGGAAAAAAAVKSRKLLVRNLAFQATTADLRSLFSAYGNVTRVCIPTQHEGRSRGFGFVDFSTRFEAAAALQALSGTHLYGRKLVLEVAAQETEGAAAKR